MQRDTKFISYSFEHENEALPRLKELVSEKEDPNKSKILSYLRMWYPAVCPGIVYDEINPGKVIGDGSLFSDGTYWWDDVFINYVDRYNIPVPEGFRTHILNNFDARMKRHMLLREIDSIEIQNNPYLGYRFGVRIYKNGVIKYNNIDCRDGMIMFIKSDDAEYIIDPIMTEIFCYDADNHGAPIIDGYHWKIIFFKNDEIIDTVEGWPNEDVWRYGEVKKIIEFVERYIPQNLGSEYMNYYQNSPTNDQSD